MAVPIRVGCGLFVTLLSILQVFSSSYSEIFDFTTRFPRIPEVKLPTDATVLELSEQATIARFNAAYDRTVRDMGYGDAPDALKITQDALESFSAYLKTKMEEAKGSQGRPKELQRLFEVLSSLSPDTLALAVLNAALHAVAHGDNWTEAAQGVGNTVHGECWAAGLLEFSPELAKRIDRSVRRKHGSLRYRKQAARSIAARAGYKAVRWRMGQTIAAGGFLLEYLLEALPDVFVKEVEHPGPTEEWWLTITPGALANAKRAIEQALRGNAVFLPCTCSPKPWNGWWDGGYWDERSRFRQSVVRTRYKATAGAIRAAMKDGTMAPFLQALNTLQSVPWRINKRVLGVLHWAYDNNIPIGDPSKPGIPPLVDIPMPEKSGAWETLSQDEKTLWKRRAGKVKQRNRTFMSQRVLMLLDLKTADLMTEAPRFYTPMNCDWRGRVYSVTSFNFQRDDRVRALFQFADGAPIGEEGLYWLKVHTANCGDFDKISKQSIAERAKWTERNLSRIEQIAWCPTKELWWTKADKPFLFLAACLELTSAIKNGASHITHLPISFDGSCSGLQHLSAMTRDQTTAAMVNLVPNSLPADIYQTVADKVKQRVMQDASEGAYSAILWKNFGVTRKLVKRNVMTYSYSSKKYGMAQQLIDDVMRPLEFEVLSGVYKEHPFGEDGGRGAVKYLAGITYDTIEALVRRPAEAMVMLQKCARALAHEGKPVTWQTPLGLPWINRYHPPNEKQLNLWLHDIKLRLRYADGHRAEIDKDRAANGVAPNFVHACDATHLLMVANACARENITQVATVHDSFGCLAPHAARFRQIIREQFVELYEKNDVLRQLLDQVKRDLTIHNLQRLPDAPAYGALNLKEVLNADYAFA